MRKLLGVLFVIGILSLSTTISSQNAVEIIGTDGFAGGCDPAINLAGITAQFNGSPTTVKVKAIAYTDYLNEITTIGTTAGGGAQVSFTINTPPDITLPENTVVQFFVGNADFSEYATVAVNCTTGTVYLEQLLGFDGRLNAGEDLPVVMFPKLNKDKQPYLEFWQVHPETNYRGRRVLTVNANTFAELPESPSSNIQIASTPGGVATLYYLTSGEFQVNYLPNAEGKVWVVIFDALSPTTIRRADYP
ncbi:MAG: hypothetical protein Kow00117_11330 [Phototrophicales bacterium]|nr:MAG: hypothetical protein CUN56_10600 [Phototrophicales bacterium]RMG74836.1 MAG: hypothetical protein D6711_07915 [Chloroflexota bacterium]